MGMFDLEASSSTSSGVVSEGMDARQVVGQGEDSSSSDEGDPIAFTENKNLLGISKSLDGSKASSPSSQLDDSQTDDESVEELLSLALQDDNEESMILLDEQGTPPRSSLTQEQEPTTPIANYSPNFIPDSSFSSQPQQYHTPLYNPFTNYSPGTRPPRREVMGVSTFFLGSNHQPEHYYQRPYQGLHTDEGLENYARQIRTELRYTEMLELAKEAERAAESGQEHFAAKPSTFGTDDDNNVTPFLSQQPKPNRLHKRNRSLSEGSKVSSRKVSLPLRRSPGSRLGVLALRDVHEVFPSFAQFHTQLRTHFARNSVESSTLVFNEEACREEKVMSPIECAIDKMRSSSSLSRKDSIQRQKAPQLDFFRNLDFHQWVRQGGKALVNGKKSESNETEVETDVGELLSGHLSAPPISNKVSRRPRVDVPPGLVEESEVLSKSKKPPPQNQRNTSSQTIETEATTSSSENALSDYESKKIREKKIPISPRALFEADQDESDADSVGGKDVKRRFDLFEDVPATPNDTGKNVVMPEGNVATGPDFVTPARLRTIRRESLKSALDEADLLLPSNSVLESPSPRRRIRAFENASLQQQECSIQQPLLGIHEALRESDSRDSSILIPIHLSQDSDHITQIFPQKSSDSDLSFRSEPADLRGSSVSAPEPGRDGRTTLVPESQLMQRSTDPSITDIQTASSSRMAEFPFSSLSGQESPVSVNGSRQRRWSVKVSVFAGRPSSNNLAGRERAPVLQQSQVVPLYTEDDASHYTNAGDCACLSLPPVTDSMLSDSFEYQADQHQQDTKTEPKMSTTLHQEETRTVSFKNFRHSRRQRNSISDALQIFSRLSPAKNMFLSRKRLYVRSKENDDFLNNYMYCSRPVDHDDVDEVRVDGFCSEPCQDTRCQDTKGPSCEDFTQAFCCATSMIDADHTPRRSTSTRTFVSLGGESQSSGKTEVENWFDRAAEKFDAMIEKLGGHHDHRGLFGKNNTAWADQWKNITFQAPSLRKCISEQARILDENAENDSDDELDLYVPGPLRKTLHARQSSLPSILSSDQEQTLFLSDPLYLGNQAKGTTVSGQMTKEGADSPFTRTGNKQKAVNESVVSDPLLTETQLSDDAEVVMSITF